LTSCAPHIEKYGISFPFFVWSKDSRNRVLDGHGRLKALYKMREAGAEIPPLPVVYIDAKDEAEAKQKLLLVNSRYGEITSEGLESFIGDTVIDTALLELPQIDIDNDARDETKISAEKNEPVLHSYQIGEFRVPLSDVEYEALVSKLTLYISDNVMPDGFFSNLLDIRNDAKRGIFFLKGRVDSIKGSEYNPRVISDKRIEDLKLSIDELGICRPIIVNIQNKTIIAGHQRFRALIAKGINTAPIFYIRAINPENEARINQIHNAIEDEDIELKMTIKPSETTGYKNIREIHAVPKNTVKALNYMYIIGRYGNIDSAVALQNGEVIKGKDYLLACYMMHIPARVYYIADEKRGCALGYLFKDYGRFDYSGKRENSYQQSLAQMNRLAKGGGNGGKSGAAYSRLYKYILEQNALEGKSALDFGAGKCAFPERV
jgi:ParB-like chromosome segregation protein Spo0J